MLVGLTSIGSAAHRVTSNPSGTFSPLTVSSGAFWARTGAAAKAARARDAPEVSTPAASRARGTRLRVIRLAPEGESDRGLPRRAGDSAEQLAPARAPVPRSHKLPERRQT